MVPRVRPGTWQGAIQRVSMRAAAMLLAAVVLFSVGCSEPGADAGRSGDAWSADVTDPGPDSHGAPEHPEPGASSDPEPSESAIQTPPAECDGKELVFTHDIVDAADRTNFNQAGGFGRVGPPSHTVPAGHGYFGIVDGAYRMPLYLPATSQLVRVGKNTHDGTQVTAALYFAICGDITNGISFHFGHISEIAPDIAMRTGCDGDSCQWQIEHDESFELEAGTLIAYVGGPHHDGANLDFGVRDATRPMDLPGSYEVWREHAHSNCPYDYFELDEIRTFYLDLLAVNMQREPRCGTMEINVAGAAQGYWFDPATPWPTSPDLEINHLVLGLETSNLEREFLATGALGSAGGWYEPTDTGQVNRASAQITADGNKYCIENMFSHSITRESVNGTVIFQMLTDEDLVAEFVDTAHCPTDVNAFEFSADAKPFERYKDGWQREG